MVFWGPLILRHPNQQPQDNAVLRTFYWRVWLSVVSPYKGALHGVMGSGHVLCMLTFFSVSAVGMATKARGAVLGELYPKDPTSRRRTGVLNPLNSNGVRASGGLLCILNLDTEACYDIMPPTPPQGFLWAEATLQQRGQKDLSQSLDPRYVEGCRGYDPLLGTHFTYTFPEN